MAFNDLASNQGVSFTNAQTGGFTLKPGQSSVTSNEQMTKLDATTKYYLDTSNIYLSPKPNNQVVVKRDLTNTTTTTTTATPVGNFIINPAYGINITGLSVNFSQSLPTFSFPANATSTQTQPMVSDYISSTVFTVTLSGTRQFGTNKTITLYVNSVPMDCQVISADGAQTKTLTVPPHPAPFIYITDTVAIRIDNSTTC